MVFRARSSAVPVILTLLIGLVLSSGCAVPLKRQIGPDRLRYPGFDTIAAATMKSGEVVEFDLEPASHAARVIGDTLYCFIQNAYRTFPMQEIASLTIHVYLPIPDATVIKHVTVTVGEKSVWLGEAIWKAVKWSAPVTLPAAMVLLIWDSFR